MFGAVKLVKNVDIDKEKYSRYSNGYDIKETFSLCNGSGFGKNVIIITADMSSSAHDDSKKIYFDSW